MYAIKCDAGGQFLLSKCLQSARNQKLSKRREERLMLIESIFLLFLLLQYASEAVGSQIEDALKTQIDYRLPRSFGQTSEWLSVRQTGFGSYQVLNNKTLGYDDEMVPDGNWEEWSSR